MADFCKQCSEELFGEDFGDLQGLSTIGNDINRSYTAVLCEGCGPTMVNSKGECVYHNGKTSKECLTNVPKVDKEKSSEQKQR